MLNSLPIRLLWHSLNWLTRLAIVASAVAAVLVAFGIIALRYWVMPDIEQYHGEITASLSQAIGNPVTIGRIEGDWRGFRPRLKIEDVRILDEQRQPALVLPRIDGSVSWLSLFSAELRLASLEIDKPELLIRRDVQGRVFIGGVALSSQSSDNDLANWLLRQSSMVVRDALIVWLDEQRDAPPLVLQQVNLRIESFFNSHRFALRALPPPELSTPLDVRGKLRGSSLDEMEEWRGQIFTQLDYTDVAAWRPWLDMPREFSRGRGALRGWVDIGEGRLAGVTADLALHNVATRLAEDVPELVLLDLNGRAAWKQVPGGLEISTRKLAMRLRNGIELRPTDFYFRHAAPGGGRAGGGELRANLLQLETLAALSNFIPLDTGLRARLDAYAPRGRVTGLNAQWQGNAADPSGYRIKGQFDDLALRQAGGMPGFSGLSLEVDGSEEGGRLSVNAHGLMVDAPGVMREPLSFATLTGQFGWRRKGGELTVKADNVAMSNDDLEGNLYGSYSTKAGTRGVLDLTVALTRGDVRRAARYTPLVALDREDNDWLAGAMLAGHTEDFRVRVKGNLSDFPLKGNEDALLEVGGHARDVTFEFDKSWPRIENIDGEFWIRGNRLEVKAASAATLGARLHNVDVHIADLQDAALPLEFKGEASGASDNYLRYIEQSPVRGYIDGFTDGMRAGGDGQLALSVRVPLLGDEPVKLTGALRVANNDISLGEGMPLLRNTRGMLAFTEAGVRADGVTSEILGGPARIDIRNAEGGALHAGVKGRVNLEVLRKLNPHPLLHRLSGGTEWEADINVVKKSTELSLVTDLVGIASTLPQPLAKRAADALPLRIEKKVVTEGQDIVSATLGDLLDIRLARREENGASVIKRGTVNFGGPGKWLDKDGVWLTGRIPLLSMEGWSGLLGDGAAGQALPLAGASLQIARLTGYGQNMSGVNIEAVSRGDGLAAQVTSGALNGEVVWLPHGFNNDTKLSARLRNLHWSLGSKAFQPERAPRGGKDATPSGQLPALEVAVENLRVNDKEIGRFDLIGHPEGREWRLRRLNIVNPDGSLSGDGYWRGAQTQVNLQLEISDAGKVLARSGYPDTVKDGSGKLAASLSWDGDPDEFNYATLGGTLKLDTGKGRFLKMDPGAGKLLSVLSLQALPKRIALDFTDVFSTGFQFDNINGTATMRNGVMDTRDFHIDGSAAKVTMTGSVDLNRETQDLRVRVLPTLGDSVSLLGAFAAGPAVGIGSLIVNKVLGNPLDKLVSFEYNVSGAWHDPVVTKVGRAPANQNDQNPSK
ncbi:MAG: TIGR02099 family protein [Gallionellales bacterium GWA2_60_18]|nr:MAG: TIGR02099 family protein [Gallionellales bacterium GWA2_60_18]